MPIRATNRLPHDREAIVLDHGDVVGIGLENKGVPDATGIMLETIGSPPLILAITSPEGVNEFIRLLDECRATVWPASKGVVRA